MNILLLLLSCLLLELPASSWSLSCDWTTDSGKLTPLIDGEQSNGTVANETECRDLCTSESSFICAAINYKAANKTCELLTENKQTATTAEDVGDWSYSVRPICAGIWLPWRTVRAGNSQSFTSSTQTKLKDCMTSCLRGTRGDDECRSVVRSVTGSTCDLHSTTVAESTSDPDILYFNRPAWYLESTIGTTKNSIEVLKRIGNYLQIFYNHTLPINGYLVGWQYNISVPGSSNRYCTSFAGIWRKVPQDMYRLIARTLLTPENPASRGVRFQFIQNETIRVEKGDILSIFSNATRSCTNVVANSDSQGYILSTDIYSSALPLGKEIPHSLSTTRRDPALRAYISEYLSLAAAPLPHHSDSLTDGQIWITLPPPLTTEDSVVIAGYRVVCSTDSTLIQTVSCYNDLVSVDNRTVLLTLPDVTKPYYTVVQVVRNFNGEELVDKKYSPVSSLFCPGRSKTTDFNITESNVTDIESEVEVNVTLLTNLTGDECAKSIKLNYTGNGREYDTGYRSTDDTIFTLLLDQRVTYNLKIYLMLKDEHEMLFRTWTRETIAVSTVASVDSTTTSVDSTTTLSSAKGLQSSNGPIIGGAIGGVLSVTIIAAAVVAAVVFYRRRQARTEQKSNGQVKVDEIALSSEFTILAVDEESGRSVKKRSSSQRSAPTSTAAPLNDQVYANLNENSTRISIDDLHTVIIEEKKRCPEEPFKEEFMRALVAKLQSEEGRTPENGPKNRFKDITAFDENRVKLTITELHTSDYVNASYIQGYHESDKKKFVAAQGPKETTAVDMWRLIHQTKATTIVMVTNLVESGKKKCWQYWPTQVSESTRFDDYAITLTEEQQCAMYVVRKLKYTVNNVSRVVTQFHYTQWFDRDVPSSSGLLSFRSRVKQHHGLSSTPIIVHCSAGVGRTGTYIALDNLMEEAHDKKHQYKSVDIFACVNKLRSQRTRMVQTADQYAFLYDMVSEAVSCGETFVSCANFNQQLKTWRLPKHGKETDISKQYKSLNLKHMNIAQVANEALSEENIHKNRDKTSLPTNRNRVFIRQPESGRSSYINAEFCNGYQQKDGFIVTQTPLPDTTVDYWRMIVEQESALIVYFNDCQEETPYWPQAQGGVITAGQITVTHIKSQTLGNGFTQTQLECMMSKSMQKHLVTLIELKMTGNELPTNQQLVTVCQKAERFATSGKGVVTVQCRNGSRHCGLFVVAMNLYLRTRIEHEIDIVLEVKLARECRKQFISNLAQFEALYDFVGYYLSEFNEYSNFADTR